MNFPVATWAVVVCVPHSLQGLGSPEVLCRVTPGAKGGGRGRAGLAGAQGAERSEFAPNKGGGRRGPTGQFAPPGKPLSKADRGGGGGGAPPFP